MAACANCEREFMPKPGDSGGYYRFSLERQLDSGETAREQLENLTGTVVTPKGRRTSRFLCPQCWNKLKDTAKYRHSLDEFFGFTEASSYVASKKYDSTQTSTFAQSEPSSSKLHVESPGLGTLPSSLKRPRFTSTPLKRKGPVERLSFGKSYTPSKWDTIITAIRARQYRRAIFGLFNATKSTKRHFTEVAARIARSEMKQLLAFGLPLCKEVNIPNIANFSWEKIINEFSENAPLLFSVLRGSITTKKNEESLMRSSVNLKPRIGTILSLLMHAKAPQKSKFLPTLFSIQLWRGRLKRETIKQLSHLGMCLGYEATLSAIDKIREDFDLAALKLKANMESTLSEKRKETVQEFENDLNLALSMSLTHDNTQTEEADTVLYSDNDDNISYTDCMFQEENDKRCESGESSDADSNSSFYDLNYPEEYEEELMEVDEEIESAHESMDLSDIVVETSGNEDSLAKVPLETDEINKIPGYCMCWDNVGKKVVTRHPTENIKIKKANSSEVLS